MSVTVVESSEVTLAALASTANAEHDAAQGAAISAVQHGLAAGEALLQAQAQVRGSWMAWCEQNLTYTYSYAALYMRMARYRSVLVGVDGEVSSLSRAKDLLAGLPAAPGGSAVYPPAVKEAARAMHAEGASTRAISELLDVHRSTVRAWCDPQEQARQRQKNRAASARRARDRASRRAAAVKVAVRKAGAATAEAYAMAERLQDVLAQASREASDREAREALARAATAQRKMRDEIVRALGVS